MANTSLALGSSLNLRRINKSVSGLSQSVSKAQSSAAGISKSLLDSNRNKRKSLSLSSTLFRRRREATLRREREDILEAGSVVGAVRRTGKVVMSSTKGFLGRILDYLGTVLIGWAVLNLPKIIDLAQSLIGRMQKYFGILNDFVSGVTQNLLQFGQKVGEVITNISTFSFNSVKDIFDDTVGKLKDSFTKMEVETYKLIRRVTGSLSQFLNYLGYDIGDFKIPGLDALIEKLEKGGGEETPSTEPETTGGGNGQQPPRPSGSMGSSYGVDIKSLATATGAAEGNYNSVGVTVRGGGHGLGKYQFMTYRTDTKKMILENADAVGEKSRALNLLRRANGSDRNAARQLLKYFPPESQDALFANHVINTLTQIKRKYPDADEYFLVQKFGVYHLSGGDFPNSRDDLGTSAQSHGNKILGVYKRIRPKPQKPNTNTNTSTNTNTNTNTNTQARAQLENILPNRRNLYESSTMASAEGSNNILIINKTRTVTKPVPIPLGGGVIMASRKYSVNSRMDQAISNLA